MNELFDLARKIDIRFLVEEALHIIFRIADYFDDGPGMDFLCQSGDIKHLPCF